MPRTLSAKARTRVIEMASAWTEKECRRRRIKCWKTTGGDFGFTAQAQEIFNQAYDHFEAVILDFKGK